MKYNMYLSGMLLLGIALGLGQTAPTSYRRMLSYHAHHRVANKVSDQVMIDFGGSLGQILKSLDFGGYIAESFKKFAIMLRDEDLENSQDVREFVKCVTNLDKMNGNQKDTGDGQDIWKCIEELLGRA